MLQLSKRDKFLYGIIITICLILSYFFKGIFYISNEAIINILTVIIGFILSAIAIIFSSSLRTVLYDHKTKGYESLWQKLISISFNTFIFNLLFVTFVAIQPICFPSWIIMGLFMNAIIELIIVIDILFKLLSIEII